MQLNPEYEIVEISNEYMAVPVGNASMELHGVVALNEIAAFLLHQLEQPKSKSELLSLLLNEYDVDKDTAQNDLDAIIGLLNEIGVILQ